MPKLLSSAALRYAAIGVVFTMLWLNLHAAAVLFEMAPGSSVWYPARGLSLALLLIFGLHYAPVLFLVSVVGGAPYHLLAHPENLLINAAIIAGVMTATAWVLRRGGVSGQWRLRDAVLLVSASAAGALATAAGVVAINVRSGILDSADYRDVALSFFVGDYLGILLVVPLAVLLMAAGPPRRLWLRLGECDRAALAKRGLEVGALVVVGGLLIWLGLVDGPSADTATTHGRWYLLLLPLGLAAVRFGPLGAAMATVLLSIAVVVVVREAQAAVGRIDLQLLLLAFAAVSLLLSAAVAERRRTLEALAAAHRREAERARAEARLARASKARFLAATTHDLRPPFEAVRLGLESLRLQQLPAEARAVVERAESAARSLSHVLDSVLDTARLDGEIRSVAPRALPLQAVLERMVAETAHRHPAGRSAVRALPTRAVAIADAVLIERLLRNLLANAVRAAAPHGRVLVGVRRRGIGYRVEVHDTGGGIDRNRIPVIFDDFVSDSAGGTGIGLSLVREIGERLGVGLEVRSTPGCGTSFSFELLRSARGPQGAEMRAVTARVRDRVIALCVLDPARRELLSVLLEDWGAAVVQAPTVQAAAQELRELGSAADVLVVDEALAPFDVRAAPARRRVSLGGNSELLSAQLRVVLGALA